jgi:hypothetical protein
MYFSLIFEGLKSSVPQKFGAGCAIAPVFEVLKERHF